MTRLVETENPAFARDVRTRALVNTDKAALEAYKKRRAREQSMQEEINTLKSEIAEMKKMLRMLIEREHGDS